MVEMDEPRVSQLPQPEQDPIPHVATPGSILPPLAVRVGFENGGYLERPKVCKLGLKLNDTTRNLCLVDERPGGNEDRARKDVELHIAGQESVQALLVEGLQAPEVPGEYELELCLSEFGGIKGLPTKEVLSRAKRAEVKKIIRIAVASGPAHALQPKIPLEVVGNEEVALQGPLACLVDACGNELTANNGVTLTLRRHAASSQDVQGTPLALVQPTAPLRLVDGVLKLEKLQLSGVAPSGQYELKFALQVVASHSNSRNVPPLHCRSSPASPHTRRTTTQ